MLSFLKKLFGATPIDYKSLMRQGAILIDVRNPGELSKGSVNDALNIPLGHIKQKVEMIKQKEKPVILFCASGMRSKAASNILKSAGVEAYNGGSWSNVQSEIGRI